MTLDKLDYSYNHISLKDSLRLSKEAKRMNIFEFYEHLIDIYTTLDKRQINELLLQDVYSLLMMYLVENFDNPEVAQGVFANEFLGQKPNYEEQIIKIGNFRFSNMALTLEQAKKVEKYCYINADKDLLGVYLLAGCCLKSLKDGVDTLLKADDTPGLRTQLKELNHLFGAVSYAKIDCLVDVGNISVVSSENKFLSLDNEFFFYN